MTVERFYQKYKDNTGAVFATAVWWCKTAPEVLQVGAFRDGVMSQQVFKSDPVPDTHAGLALARRRLARYASRRCWHKIG